MIWPTCFATPRAGELHLRPFLLASAVCDSDHPSIVELSRQLVADCESLPAAASAVQSWVRRHIVYTLEPMSDRASVTLQKREGMCTNKANLQIALLRAAGIPAGYSLVHITKEAFKGPHMLPEVYDPISEVTLHVFCSVYIPAAEGVSGEFRAYDATEREGGSHLTEYLPATDETRYRATWLRGPTMPAQGCLDHQLLAAFKSRIPPDRLAAQNDLWRKHRI